jgi:hypothetical protein
MFKICMAHNIFEWHMARNNMQHDINEKINAINFCIILRNTLLQYVQFFPEGWIIRQKINENDRTITLMIENQNNKYADIVLSDPNWTNGGRIVGRNGFAYMMCGVSNFNGFFMELVVDDVNSFLQVLAFCHQVFEYQQNNEELDFSRMPPNLLNQWFVPDHVRNWQN